MTIELTFDELVQAAQKLALDKRKMLIDALQQHIEREATFHALFGLQVFDVGPWPEELTLRREDDDDRH